MASALEAGFRAAFWLAGRRRRPVREWASSGGLRVLAVAPHPDDETVGCGGTLARHARSGDDVRVVFVTDGRRSRAFGLGPDEMARRRQAEAEAASRALGVTAIWLGEPEGEWRDEEVRRLLGEVLAGFSPHVVYAPSRVDFHPEHVRVARALAVALQGLRPAPVVRVYPIQVPLTSLLANLATPVREVEAELVKALAAYETQAGSTASARRQRAYAAAAHRMPGPVEELWELSAEAFTAFHGAPESAGPAYRGLRSFPLTDPLAYGSGRTERCRLAGIAGSPPGPRGDAT